MIRRLKLCGLLGVVLLAGCAILPASGPADRDIHRGAVSSVEVDRRHIGIEYVLVDITNDVVNLSETVALGSFYRSFGERAAPAPTIKVGEGDSLQVTVFESAAGGLFVPTEAGVRPGNFVTLPAQQVSKSGTISIPYGGQVQATGRTVLEIQAEVERRLAKRAVEPQVVITLLTQSAATVSVVGEVASQLQVRPNERLLDVVARAGGAKEPGYELFVTLQRNGRAETVHFPTIVRNPRENIYIHPGDTVYVYRKPQTFVAVGALGAGGQTSGITGIFSFDQEVLSLNEAIAKAGGLIDTRAKPSSVYVYRNEYRRILESAGVDTSKFRPEQDIIPTVYRANFRDPSSFFLAQRFPIRHKDAIYVANADSVEIEKFLSFTQNVTGTVSGVAEDALVTRNSIRALGN